MYFVFFVVQDLFAVESKIEFESPNVFSQPGGNVPWLRGASASFYPLRDQTPEFGLIYYISPFIGWKEANGEETRNFIEEIVTIRDNYDFDSQIIVAAVRNARQIVDAALVGADIVTAGLSVYRGGFHHPYTREGIEKFTQFWDKTQYE
jgi:transaldolase